MSLGVFESLTKQVEQLNQQSDSGRLPHARLFVGKLGSGLLPVTLRHVAYMLTGDANNTQVLGLNHPDVHFSFPIVLKQGVASSDDCIGEWRDQLKKEDFFNLSDWTNHVAGDANKSAIIGKDESERIVHKLNLKSYLGGKKILIIWAADHLHHATANKLLKLIEEPPEETFIILLAEQPDQILTTILSRCQVRNIQPPTSGEIAAYLREKEEIDHLEANKISALCEGDVGLALSYLADQEESNIFHQLFKAWMRMCYKKDLPGLIDWTEEIHGLKREKQKRFIHYSINFFRQCMLERYLGEQAALLFGEEKQFATNFGKFVHGANIVELMECLNEEHYHIERNGNAKVVFLDLSVKIIRLLHKTSSLERA